MLAKTHCATIRGKLTGAWNYRDQSESTTGPTLKLVEMRR